MNVIAGEDGRKSIASIAVGHEETRDGHHVVVARDIAPLDRESGDIARVSSGSDEIVVINAKGPCQHIGCRTQPMCNDLPGL